MPDAPEIVSEDPLEQEAAPVQTLGDEFDMLGIAMLVDRSNDEQEELGTYEWLMLYGTLFDSSDQAGELYSKAKEALGGTKDETTNKA